MQQQTNTLIKNTLIYSVGNFGSRFLAFLLIPIYSYFLTKSELGYFDLVVVTTGLIAPFISLHLSESAYRWLLELQAPNNRMASRIVTSSLSVIILNTVVCVAGFVVYYLFRPFQHPLPLLLFWVSHCLLPFFLQFVRGLRQNKLYAICGILNALILFISNLILLVVLKMGVQALLISAALANFITIAVILIKTGIFQMIARRYFSPALVRRFVRYSLPLLPNVISWWMIDSANRYLILHYLGPDSNGIYALAARFPTLLVVVNSIFYMSWQESAITEYKNADRDAFYSRIFHRFFILEMSAVLFLIAISRVLVTNVVNPDFAEAWQYTPLLFLSVAFSAFSAFWGTGYLSSKQTMGAFTTTIFGAMVNIILSLILIPRIGLFGAVIGSTSGFLALWLLRIFTTRKYFHIHIPAKTVVLYAALSLLFLFLQFRISSTIGTIIMITAAGGIFLLANRSLMLQVISRIKTYIRKR